MDYEESRVRMIAGDLKREITQDDKLYILALSQRLGVEKMGCKTCPDYYRDLALMIYTTMSKQKKQDPQEKPAKYALKDGVDVIFGGVRVNAATMTEQLGEWLVKHNFPQRFWA